MTKQQKPSHISNKAWAGKSKALRGITFSAAVLAVTAVSVAAYKAPEAGAAIPSSVPSHSQTMTYQLYAGGINAVRAKLDISLESPERYHLQLDAHTRGFLGRIVPWEGTFQTKGWRLRDGERPEQHKSIATFRNDEDIKRYHYGRDGSFRKLEIVENGKSKPQNDLEKELVQGTTDVLTATLNILNNVAYNNSCEGSAEVFDGKRRFELVFREKGTETLKSNRYNIFDGDAIECEVEVVPVAGAWHSRPRGWASIQEQGREKGSLPTVWLAQMDDKGPAIPVKMRVKTDYGVLFMHLIGYKNGTKQLGVVDG